MIEAVKTAESKYHPITVPYKINQGEFFSSSWCACFSAERIKTYSLAIHNTTLSKGFVLAIYSFIYLSASLCQAHVLGTRYGLYTRDRVSCN